MLDQTQKIRLHRHKKDSDRLQVVLNEWKENCVEEVCWLCKGGHEVFKLDDDQWYHCPIKKLILCNASDLHNLGEIKIPYGGKDEK